MKNTQFLMKSWERAVQCLVYFFFPTLCPFLPPLFLPQLFLPGHCLERGCSAEGWICPPHLCSFFLLPVALHRETVVSSFHSACWCSNNSWLRRKETTSSSYLGIEVMRLVVFHFSTARDLQVCAGVPFVSSKAPIVREPRPCFYTSRKLRAM